MVVTTHIVYRLFVTGVLYSLRMVLRADKRLSATHFYGHTQTRNGKGKVNRLGHLRWVCVGYEYKCDWSLCRVGHAECRNNLLPVNEVIHICGAIQPQSRSRGGRRVLANGLKMCLSIRWYGRIKRRLYSVCVSEWVRSGCRV